MSLENKIIEVLSEGKPLKGREIASILSSKHGLNVDKAQVNSLLYGNLRGKAFQNKKYEWSLKQEKGEETNSAKDVVGENTPLSKLAYYYLECLSKDMEGGISVFATSKYKLDYTQLSYFPLTGSVQQSIDAHLLDKVRKNKNEHAFKLGYPMFVRSVKSRDATVYRFIEPLFIFTVDTEFALKNGTILLLDDDPVLNQKALESITGINTSAELLLETVELYEELGINNSPEEKPALDDLGLRLEQIRSDWKWRENLDVGNLSSGGISSIADDGIFNKAAVFVGQKSKYTVGLEKDLRELADLPESKYAKSMLGSWISDTVEPTQLSDKVLIEPIPLNEEQKEAVLRGLSSPLTVVTGPPGTGKSQVVASLIVNAVYQRQTVLFSSKNNKAVDVVNERVNALTNRPIMLRLGSRFQSTLSEYLSGLLSARPSKGDETRFKETKSIHDEILKNISTIKRRQEEIIALRNKVDELEKSVENFRVQFGAAFFAACQNRSADETMRLHVSIDIGKEKVKSADKSKQSLFVKLIWSFVRKSRFLSLQKWIEQCSPRFSSLDIPLLLLTIDDSTVPMFREYIERLAFKNTCAKVIQAYFEQLQNLIDQPDLFSLSVKEKAFTDQIVSNSLELWNCWLQLMPKKMSEKDRKVIGDYVAVLNLIVAAETTNKAIDRHVWSKYYSFLPQITHILSCWAVTSLSARGRVPLEQGFFDLVIIDEASQCDIASALPLLFRAKRAVIIGDDRQLTHISAISETQDIQLLQKHNLDEDFLGWSYSGNSLFRLACARARSENIVALRDHHRSHADIINYSNQHFYENTLRVATQYETLKAIPNEPVVRWIDVKGKCARPETGSTYNDKEAEHVVRELSRLVSNGYKGTIGVVTPFRAQYLRIQDRLNQNKDLSDRLTLRDFLCDTVHKFQGDERDVIIFSPVVSAGVTDSATAFLRKTGNLFNVAITRARAALIVVGDNQKSYTLGVPHYKAFIEYINTLSEKRAMSNDRIQHDLGPKYPNLSTKTIISDWEKVFYEALYKAGIPTIPQHGVGQYSLDLAIIDGDRKLNIEIDGEKYHRNWDGELLRRDQLRNKRLIELGWDVQRFWVYQIRDNMKQCIEKVGQWKRQEIVSS